MKHRIIIIVSSILILLIIFIFIPFRTALVFYEENTNHLEAFLPLSAGDTFKIIFTHSIHLTDVEEKYVITDDLTIKQYEIVYEEFGIGMPSNAEEEETFEYEDGKYYVKDLDNYFPSMNIRNGKTVSENRLAWKYKTSHKENPEEEHMIWFNEFFEPGAWFTVKVERLSFLEYWRGEKIHE